ncbi:hypothetical protein DDB_G0290495 [Dictyostelium discoideum AX4]|uniref:DUF1279 domain-containing protein n=1 Tax=Dictyostelium discoideum TaxID=44689 RepID=Q54G09_DICDI|nr:hypothetical protein DDB_G0290495 [Dictyostelium discoideum AX4]EAL62108.1 hypothetical protein DDB_G0290495 [Dictyostelium discoideum AX4]|eukprot:XP_635608.1 hypothetical protein DDB_G0290495 [Dictyostelium discoideum AX4]
MLKSIRTFNTFVKTNYLYRNFSNKPLNYNNNNSNKIITPLCYENNNNKSLFNTSIGINKNNKLNNNNISLFSNNSILPIVSNIRKFSSSSNLPNSPKQEKDNEKDNEKKNEKENKKDNDDDDDGIDEKEKLKKLSTGEKIKYMFSKYGKLALIVHFGIYFATMGSFYVLFSSGVDINNALDFLHIPRNAVNPSLGAFAVAFACTKISTVVRTPLTLITVPLLARYLSRAGKKL